MNLSDAAPIAAYTSGDDTPNPVATSVGLFWTTTRSTGQAAR